MRIDEMNYVDKAEKAIQKSGRRIKGKERKR